MLPERFREKFVKVESGCWIWTAGHTVEGYGLFHVPSPRKMVRAHRFAYENLVGPIPKGLQIDHICRKPACVNPDHMRVVTSRENTLAGTTWPAINALKTKCHRGHPLSGENLYRCPRSKRRCRICRKEYEKAYAVPGLRG